MRLYFNPDCSKSKAALALLTAAGHAPTVIDYQRTPPDRATLARLITKLDVPPTALLRPNDDGIDGTDDAARIIELLLAVPERLQRPILETAERAIIARPPERVFELVADRTRESDQQ